MISVADNNELLYFSPPISGGMADYAREQANAIVDEGFPVHFLTSVEFKSRATDRFHPLPLLPERTSFARKDSRLASRVGIVRSILGNFGALAEYLEKSKIRHALLASYAEYLAPLWAGRLRKLARRGVKFGAVIHDPVRDVAIGPRWFHRWSVAEGYSFLREAFVHEAIQLDTFRPADALRTSVIPHGPYHFPEPSETRSSMRKKLGVPESAFVALSFGYIRDGKNLNLAIQALASLPSVHLLIAGREQSFGQKPVAYYRNLAGKFGVHDRCHWVHGHIPEEDVGNLFAASDLLLLTYSRAFRSASGVLNTAVSFRKPCVASSGGGNLRSVVEKYRLGHFIEPDSLHALEAGIKAALRDPLCPCWEAYEADNSWQLNAQIIASKMFDRVSCGHAF